LAVGCLYFEGNAQISRFWAPLSGTDFSLVVPSAGWLAMSGHGGSFGGSTVADQRQGAFPSGAIDHSAVRFSL